MAGGLGLFLYGMTVTPDREKNVLFSDTYTSSSQVIIVRKK